MEEIFQGMDGVYPEKFKFAQWTPDQRRAFRIAILVDGQQMQFSENGVVWNDCEDSKNAVDHLNPNYYVFRIKHVDPIPDAIDWSHVSAEIVSIDRQYGREATLREADRTLRGFANLFSSFQVGNLPKCTIWRAGHEPKMIEPAGDD